MKSLRFCALALLLAASSSLAGCAYYGQSMHSWWHGCGHQKGCKSHNACQKSCAPAPEIYGQFDGIPAPLPPRPSTVEIVP